MFAEMFSGSNLRAYFILKQKVLIDDFFLGSCELCSER